MGKCVSGANIPYFDKTICDGCIHKDVCGNADYLSENNCPDKILGDTQHICDLLAAEKDYRLIIIPKNYQKAEEFYHVVNCPRTCNEDHCEHCRFSKSDDCSYKPHVVPVSPQRVWSAVYDLHELRLTPEEAEAALKEDKA